MNSRKLFALFLVLALTGSALALQQQNLYHNTGFEAEGVAAIQQHTVFVEIIVEQEVEREQINQFAAVVGLVKKCKQARNVFDNAVLWFNDQFLFGNKTNDERNETEGDLVTENGTSGGFLGENPDRTHNETSAATTDGFIQANSFEERWGGCFIPNGFVHAIGADDPFSTGNVTSARAQADTNQSNPGYEEDFRDDSVSVVDSIGVTKDLMDLDESCGGCIFTYIGTFYVTDPNDHRWMIDKYTYPLNLASDILGDDADNCHINADTLYFGCGAGQDIHRDTSEDDSGTNEDNHCDDAGTNECGADTSGPFFVDNTPQRETTKLTTNEPLFTVHLQVDSDNPDRQGFADEAIWAYKDGDTRPGMPYANNPSQANYEYCKNGTGSAASSCAIEYNFLVAVDFEAFDDNPLGSDGFQRDTGDVGGVARATAHTQGEGQGENEIQRNKVQHGPQAADGNDTAEDGNSHPHNPYEDAFTPTDENGDGTLDTCNEGADGIPDASQPIDSDGDGNEDMPCSDPHQHDAVSLDLFFSKEAPHFTETNPYWDQYGAPPVVNDTCTDTLDTNSTFSQAIQDRTVIVCDVTAADGFHLHDGSQTVQAD